MTTVDSIATTTREAQSMHDQNEMGLNSVGRLSSDPNCLFDIEVESNNSLIPIPWPVNEKLCIPYGNADIPFLKKLLFSSDCTLISKSLQALVDRAYDSFKAMDMLRLDVFSPLNRLIGHQEPFVRQRCCTLIRVLAGQPTGKVSVMLNAVLVRKFLALMADAVYGVRYHCAMTAMTMAEHRLANEAMVRMGFGARALDRLYEEQDDRVVPALLRTVGLLLTRCADLLINEVTADDESAREPRSVTAADALRLVVCGLQPAATGRGLLDYLKRSIRSPDYRTVLDSVMCMSRSATVREANEYLARDQGTVDLLVSFVSSQGLRGRALRVFSAQLLCTMAGTTSGLVHMNRAITDEMVSERWYEDDDPAAERYLQKLAYVISTIQRENQKMNHDDH